MRIMHGLPAPSRRTLVLVWAVALIAFLLLGVYGVAALSQQSDEIADLHQSAVAGKADRADLRSELDKQQHALDIANAKLIKAGKTPVVTSKVGPSDLPILLQGLRGVPGPVGPAAPPAKNGRNGSNGSAGRSGSDGLNGSNGTDGAPGKDGINGTNGAVGPAGPGPTDDQIADAIAAYCNAHDQCRGPAGPPGLNAPPLDPIPTH